ncbi:MAG: M1 family metallopeptidase [Deltaproteobacteria bacterium]|nr:M1 family metallopeptidase [Deltaproteobacteria bacterium]
MSARAYRLGSHVRPTHYRVELAADPERSDFDGRVVIELEIDRETRVIELHGRELKVSDASFVAGGERRALQVSLDPDRQLVRFEADGPLSAGTGRIEARFAGQLSASMHGIYLATDGSARAICTQCEATDARAIYPCFDEPAFKAPISWTLKTRHGLVALANGPLRDTQREGGVAISHFHPTKPVSSYLAAVTIGELESSPERTVNGIPLRVWGTRGKVGQTGFALDFTAKLLPWYESYFGVPYPFAKYDQVAVPGFDAGAMENVGLVLFRQNLLLMDAGTASWRQEKVIAKVIAHEFAHMWFGNLVTMQWWDDLWLNEAFAEWMAHKAVDAMTPDYRVWEDFQDDKNRALADDALPATHPIWTAVETPEQALEMFDVITYQKGCAVMRMLESFLGESAFREGLRSYMKAYAYKNAAGPDLWRELERSSGEPVSHLMQSWISVSGFPLVSVALTDAGGRPAIKLEQQRFFSSAARAKEESPELWDVPVVARFEDDEGVKEHRFILASRAGVEALPAIGRVRWCYPNAGEIGFYRMRLSAPLGDALLTDGLGKLSAVEQMGLLEDQWALVKSANGTIEEFLRVLDALASPRAGGPAPITDHNVLRAVADRLGTLEHLLEDSGDLGALDGFRAWVRSQLSSDLAALGIKPRAGESQNDIQRRAVLIHAVGKIGRDPATCDAAVAAAQDERHDPRSVDPNLAGTFLAITAMLGDEVRFERWLETYRARKESGAPPQITLRYLYTFAEFRPPALVARTLRLIEDGTIPQEATAAVLSQLLGLRHAQLAAWTHLTTGWEALKKRVGDMGVSRVVEAVGALPFARRAEIVRFFDQHPPAGAERALSRALERMDEREELRSRITPSLSARFR